MQVTQKQLLLIFIKNPQKGEVKTRLAAKIGDKKALAVYKKLLVHTQKVAWSVRAVKQLWYSHFITESDKWDKNEFEKKTTTR